VSSQWTAADIPDQTGRVVIVTGANAGLGLATTAALAGRGATVVMACRDGGRAEAARTTVRNEHPDADLAIELLNLADLDSVRAFADAIDGPVDLLINNAGVMGGPRGTTPAGFERQMGINHLGHFALTGLLVDRLRDVPGSRIVTVASLAAESDSLDLDDLQTRRAADWGTAYQASKQANAVFALELQRRLAASGAETISLAAHPGISATSLSDDMVPSPLRAPVRWALSAVVNSAEQGALPQLRAATDPHARGGDYYGPDGFRAMRGGPARQPLPPRADDRPLGRELWQRSEELTGVHYLHEAD
jgi:NAD(P)-dependent dehydrogenase (short-subunit alcohol dehydrogenase family)